MWETEKRWKALQLSLQCDFRLEVVDKERLTGKPGKGAIWASNDSLLLGPRKQKHWLSQSSGSGSEIDVIWLESVFSIADGSHNHWTEGFHLPRWQNNSYFFQTQEPSKPSQGHFFLGGTHASRGGIIIMVPIDQMTKLRLRDLIKVTQISTWKAKHKPRVTVLKLWVFAPHRLRVVGGDLATMLRQKQAVFRL